MSKNTSIIAIVAIIAICVTALAVSGGKKIEVSQNQAEVVATTTPELGTTTASTTQINIVPVSKSPTAPRAAVSQIKHVTMKDLKFQESTIRITRGTTVVWTNNDGTAHTVSGLYGKGPESNQIYQWGTFSYTFKTPGTFPYICKFYPTMKGTVIVE